MARTEAWGTLPTPYTEGLRSGEEEREGISATEMRERWTGWARVPKRMGNLLASKSG